MLKYNFSKIFYVIIYYKHTCYLSLQYKLKMSIQKHPLMTIVNIVILAIILTYVQAMKVKCGYCTNIPETKYVTILTSVILVEVLAVVFFPTQMRNFFMNNM